MKTFFAALLLMATIIGFAATNTTLILKKADELLAMAEAFPDNTAQFLAKKDTLAHEASTFTALWDRTLPFFSYTSNHQNLSRADAAASLLYASIQSDSATDFIAARADFIDAMRKLRDLESISFSSVF